MSDETRKDQRVKVQTLKAKYKSATVEEFIDQYAADISRGGIFIKTPKPPPNGTLLKIEIQLKDATPVISAVGRVVWRREQPEGGQAAGMGIKFVKVDEASQSVVDRIVAIKGEDAGPRFDSAPPAAETLGNPAGENTSEFFGTTNPSEEMPAPQDRTMMRQMSAFLGEALRGAVAEPEAPKPGPSSATPGAAKPAATAAPAPAPAAPPSAGVPGVASAGRPAGMKPAVPKATMVGIAPAGAAGVSPMAAFAAEAQAKAAAADAAEAAKPVAPEPAKAAPAAAGLPGKGPVKPIGKGTMVGLAPMAMPAPSASAVAPKLAEPEFPAAPSTEGRPGFESDDGGSTAVADRSQIDQLLRDASKEDGLDAPEPAKPAMAIAAAHKPAPPPVEDDDFAAPADEEPEPAKPVAKPAPVPAPAPPVAAPPPAAPAVAAAAPPAPSAPVPPGTAAPVPAAPAALAAPAANKPPVILFAIIGLLVVALIGVVAMFAMKK